MRSFGHVLHRLAVHDAIGSGVLGAVGLDLISAIRIVGAIVARVVLHGRPLDSFREVLSKGMDARPQCSKLETTLITNATMTAPNR